MSGDQGRSLARKLAPRSPAGPPPVPVAAAEPSEAPELEPFRVSGYKGRPTIGQDYEGWREWMRQGWTHRVSPADQARGADLLLALHVGDFDNERKDRSASGWMPHSVVRQ